MKIRNHRFRRLHRFFLFFFRVFRVFRGSFTQQLMLIMMPRLHPKRMKTDNTGLRSIMVPHAMGLRSIEGPGAAWFPKNCASQGNESSSVKKKIISLYKKIKPVPGIVKKKLNIFPWSQKMVKLFNNRAFSYGQGVRLKKIHNF